MQPGHHKDAFPMWVWVALAAILVLCTPWWIPDGWVEPTVWGFPFWGVLMVGGFVVLAVFTAWVYELLWSDEDDETSEDELPPDEWRNPA